MGAGAVFAASSGSPCRIPRPRRTFRLHCCRRRCPSAVPKWTIAGLSSCVVRRIFVVNPVTPKVCVARSRASDLTARPFRHAVRFGKMTSASGACKILGRRSARTLPSELSNRSGSCSVAKKLVSGSVRVLASAGVCELLLEDRRVGGADGGGGREGGPPGPQNFFPFLMLSLEPRWVSLCLLGPRWVLPFLLEPRTFSFGATVGLVSFALSASLAAAAAAAS